MKNEDIAFLVELGQRIDDSMLDETLLNDNDGKRLIAIAASEMNNTFDTGVNMQAYTFSVTVTAPEGTEPSKAKELLAKFIKVGKQEASDSREIAEEDGYVDEIDFADACEVKVAELIQ